MKLMYKKAARPGIEPGIIRVVAGALPTVPLWLYKLHPDLSRGYGRQDYPGLITTRTRTWVLCFGGLTWSNYYNYVLYARSEQS